MFGNIAMVDYIFEQTGALNYTHHDICPYVDCEYPEICLRPQSV